MRAERTRRPTQGGFTLIEMMVVVAIVALTATIAAVYIRPSISPIDTATAAADLMREAARRAVLGGPVRADVALNVGKSRARIRVPSGGDGTILVLEVLREDALPSNGASWVELTRMVVTRQVTPIGWKSTPQVNDGGTAPTTTSFSGFEVQCTPDGRCGVPSGGNLGGGVTLYYRAVSNTNRIARTIILPLGGAVLARNGL